jgi:hypothetical protein
MFVIDTFARITFHNDVETIVENSVLGNICESYNFDFPVALREIKININDLYWKRTMRKGRSEQKQEQLYKTALELNSQSS